MYVLFDIGGTRMRIGVSSGGREITAHKILPTPPDFKEALDVLSLTAHELAKGEAIQGVVGGLPGTFHREKKILTRASHLKKWEGKSIQEEIEKIFKAPVYLENDAVLAGLGEALFGAGKGHPIVGYLTVSTGVGGARIVNGAIDASVSGFEPGHQIIDLSSAVEPGRNPAGTLEGFISGSALKRHYGVSPQEITDKHVWEELAEYLAYGLYNSTLYWSPDIIVVGGPMVAGHPAIDLHLSTLYLKKLLASFPHMPIVAVGTLGALGGLYGGLSCLNKFFK